MGFALGRASPEKTNLYWFSATPFEQTAESKQWNRDVTQKLVSVHFTRHLKPPVYFYWQAFNLLFFLFGKSIFLVHLVSRAFKNSSFLNV